MFRQLLCGPALFVYASMICTGGIAHAALVISSGPTSNVTCTDGVCMGTAEAATLNTGDLMALLAKKSVLIEPMSDSFIRIADPFTWNSGHMLSLQAYKRAINAAVDVAGPGQVGINIGDLSQGLTFGLMGSVRFEQPTSSKLRIGNVSYTLVTSLAQLAQQSAILQHQVVSSPPGYSGVALANSIDAKADGTYTGAPVSIVPGFFEGMGNTIANLSISSSGNADVGLFATGTGLIRGLRLQNVNISATGDIATGAVVGGNVPNAASLYLLGVSVDGKVSGSQSVGGLIGATDALHAHECASNTIVTVGSNKEAVAGGIAGDLSNYAQIKGSYAYGTVKGFDRATIGGLVGKAHRIELENDYAIVEVDSGKGSIMGGLIGSPREHYGPSVRRSYAVTSFQASLPRYVGGLYGGPIVRHGGFYSVDTYWDETVSQQSNASGNGVTVGNAQPLTTTQLQSALPDGFDKEVWRSDSKVNGGYPYLRANPPS